ncbi:MAG: hypothetical protein QOE36_2561 [Gaiellaceae bacterium]|jgi:hypothetical protein|nr:hypothetical protein [Gaiellaceae bacterium]
MRVIRTILAAVVLATVAGLSAIPWGASSAGGAAALRWRGVAVGREVPDFEAVAALSSHDVWAVGSNAKLPVAAHWDGRSLTVMEPFPLSGTGSLHGVSALAPDDVWAVGTLDTGAESSEGVVVHWDGLHWERVTAPLPSRGTLAGVTALSDSDVWIDGSYDARVEVTDPADSGTVARPLLLHWDGHGWTRADVSALMTPCPWREDDSGDGQPGWVWECGSSGGAIDATGRDDVWAVTTETSWDLFGYGSKALHFNGTSWIAPEPAAQYGFGAIAADVDAAAAGEAWTLDDFVDPRASCGSYRLNHWTQSGRSVRSVDYQTRGAGVIALAAVSRTSGWIVGRRWSNDCNKQLGPIVIHWNRGRATRIHTVLDARRGASLTSIDALSPVEIWAAGDHLLARYSR